MLRRWTRGERGELNSLEATAFGGIISALRPRAAFVDACDTNEERFAARVREAAGLPVEITSRHRADSTFPVVSAASIVAKVKRDEEVEKIARSFARDAPALPPLGSGYPSDDLTTAFIRTWIKERGMLPPHARASWRTSKRLLSEASAGRLDEW